MIHGNAVSVGCIAMGDEVAEDIFIMAADTGLAHNEVLIAPLDVRSKTIPTSTLTTLPRRTDELYRQIREKLARLPHPG